MTRKSGIVLIFLLVAALVILLTGCDRSVDTTSSATWTETEEQETALAVEVLEVQTGKLYPRVEASGVISGIREAFVVSETRGVIREVAFEIGDRVEEGSLLLRVDDNIPRLSMEQARQQYETARLDLEAVEAFHAKGNASTAELIRARGAANGALAAYESAVKVFEDTSIRSPLAGAVAWKDPVVAQGNYISQGGRVARVVDMSALNVELSVGERQVGLIDLNAPARIFVSAPCGDLALPGRVTAIAAGSDAATGSFTVLVGAENTCGDSLRSGMSARVVITVEKGEDLTIVPTASLVVREGKEYVFLEREGTAEAVEIEKAGSVGNRTALRSGISAGDRVIVSGISGLRPGMKVQPRLIEKSEDLL